MFTIKRIVKKYLPKKIRSLIELKFKKFYSANLIDKKLLKFLNYNNGYYIEVGANDGILQSNTLYFEKKKKWSGLLIEPIKEKFEQLKKNRSNKNKFENYALVSKYYKKKKIKLIYSDLMTTTISNKNDLNIKKHLTEASKHLNIFEKEKAIICKAISLNKLIQKHKLPYLIDFFSLDVEGYELEVLKGINFNKYNFKYLLVECIENFETIKSFLKKKNYKYIRKMSNIDYLFKFK